MGKLLNIGLLKRIISYTTETTHYLSRYDSLQDAIDSIGSSEASLLINRNEILTHDTIIPDNITLKGKPGYVIDGPYTLTINGFIDANSKIFGSSINVKGNIKNDYVKDIWFGPAADGVTDDTLVLQRAINFAHNTYCRHLKLMGRRYKVTDTLRLYYDPVLNPDYWIDDTEQARIKISGQYTIDGRDIKKATKELQGTVIYYANSTGVCIECGTSNYTGRRAELEALVIESESSDFAIDSNGTNEMILNDVKIKLLNPSGKGVRFYNNWTNRVRELHVSGVDSITYAPDSVAIVFDASTTGGGGSYYDIYTQYTYTGIQILHEVRNATFHNVTSQLHSNRAIDIQAAIRAVTFTGLYIENTPEPIYLSDKAMQVSFNGLNIHAGPIGSGIVTSQFIYCGDGVQASFKNAFFSNMEVSVFNLGLAYIDINNAYFYCNNTPTQTDPLYLINVTNSRYSPRLSNIRLSGAANKNIFLVDYTNQIHQLDVINEGGTIFGDLGLNYQSITISGSNKNLDQYSGNFLDVNIGSNNRTLTLTSTSGIQPGRIFIIKCSSSTDSNYLEILPYGGSVFARLYNDDVVLVYWDGVEYKAIYLRDGSGSGTTRPDTSIIPDGYKFRDTNINKIIYKYGDQWYDSNNTPV